MCCITCFVIEAESRLDEKLRLQLLSHFSLYVHFKAPNPSNYILLTDLTAFVACTVFSSALARLKKGSSGSSTSSCTFSTIHNQEYVTSASSTLSMYLPFDHWGTRCACHSFIIIHIKSRMFIKKSFQFFINSNLWMQVPVFRRPH